MRENPKDDTRRSRRPSPARTSAIVAAVLALTQACLTIEGRGIEGFVLWVLILFIGYWLLFAFLIWIWRRFKDRA